MDIRDWPMDRIMQLPDCAFGRRWVVALSGYWAAAAGGIIISGTSLPERAVLWELRAQVSLIPAGADSIDWQWAVMLTHDPDLAEPEVRQQQPLFPGMGAYSAGQWWLYGCLSLCNLRTPYATAGRRLAVDILPVTVGPNHFEIVTVWSSIPREVPDCLCSGIR